MILSVTITAFWVVGLKINLKDYTFTEFIFNLPFPHFRNDSKEYWKEVIDHIYALNGCSKEDAELIICTEDETILKSDLVKFSSKISSELTDMGLPVAYVGESKGFIDGIVYPLVINPGDFYRWFSLAEDINQVENHFYNRQLYGLKEPKNEWERGYEESLYREKLTFLFDNIQTNFLEKSKNIILMGEGTFYLREDKKVILSFLDAINKEGYWTVYYDNLLTLLNLQLLKKYNNKIGDDVYKNYDLKDLAGCLVVPDAQKINLNFNDGTHLQVNLEYDSLSVLPLNKSTKVEVKVGYKDRKDVFYTVSGGEFGLIVDNRVRPLLKDKNSKQRLSLINKWLKEISSTIEFDEAKNNTLNLEKEENKSDEVSISELKEEISKVVSEPSKKSRQDDLAPLPKPEPKVEEKLSLPKTVEANMQLEDVTDENFEEKVIDLSKGILAEEKAKENELIKAEKEKVSKLKKKPRAVKKQKKDLNIAEEPAPKLTFKVKEKTKDETKPEKVDTDNEIKTGFDNNDVLS